ncbi:hypothetical protein CBU02nite_35090 [Clostridium butyricum]|uniref:Uncharacterized protein n=1 Tax=Clostridium butyricum TaxID=1492 RepID=A0A512TSB0_CLOBU|nr:hypothetical protein CBU02nite_35090 [Clostridium butyricum]
MLILLYNIFRFNGIILKIYLYLYYFPATFNAVFTTFSTVNPNCSNNLSAGPDAPNVSSEYN